ncbi:MAG: hypothetical protein P4L51_03960 [Puia sp.]|nr:hypothetical protein [Puia sp.]
MNTLTYSKRLDFLANVLLPVALGGLLYRLLRDRTGSYLLIRNYMPDGLWAYAFLSCVLIIWERQINRTWILAVFFAAALFEYLQFVGLIAGTGDEIDICVYFTSFGLALLSNKYILKIPRLEIPLS